MVIELEPIGVVRTPFVEKALAPRQPSEARDVRGVVTLFEGRGLEDALDGLASFDTIWILFHFHKTEGHFRPKVQPPRSDRKRGVLATRSPHRPNAIGMSAVRLERIEGLSLHVSGVDMVDGSPVLDIKPYVAYCDAIPDASHGWLGERSDPGPRFTTAWSELATAQIAHLGEGIQAAVETLLSTGPEPHAYRRIKRLEGDKRELSHKSWRFTFRVDGNRVLVESIRSGYRPAELAREDATGDVAVHRAFVEAFGTR